MKRMIINSLALILAVISFMGTLEEIFPEFSEISACACSSQAKEVTAFRAKTNARIAAKTIYYDIKETLVIENKNYNYENTDALQDLVCCGRRAIYVGGVNGPDNIIKLNI